MKLRPSSPPSSERGFTIVEFMIAMGVSALILAIITSSIFAFNNLFESDSSRMQVTQNLRAGMTLMGVQIRQTGESLNTGFPAIELVNGGSTDTLIIRKNLLDEVPRVCTDITAGDSYVQMALSSTAGCGYSDTASIYSAWATYRDEQDSKTADAYVYDSANDIGEWFTYSGESESSSSPEYRRLNNTTVFANDYPSGSSNVYMLEEWRFSVTNEILEVQVNQGAVQNIIAEITDFQVEIVLQDGTTVNTFATTDDWTDIRFIRVTLTSSASVGDEDATYSLVNTFYPRNLLSKD